MLVCKKDDIYRYAQSELTKSCITFKMNQTNTSVQNF